MQKIKHLICILKNVEEVYHYLSTPKNRPEWNHLTTEVKGRIHHSLEVGEEFSENTTLGSWKSLIQWKVIESIPLKLWHIRGHARGLGTVDFEYHFTRLKNLTLVDQEFHYTLQDLHFAMIDHLLVHHRLDVQLDESFSRFEDILNDNSSVTEEEQPWTLHQKFEDKIQYILPVEPLIRKIM